jgi:hypothetical protein
MRLDKTLAFISTADAANTVRKAGVLAGDYWFAK